MCWGCCRAPMQAPRAGRVYSAHYDHLGIDPAHERRQHLQRRGRQRHRRAGYLLELAHAFAASPARPPHPVLFAAVTAEEKGLLGSNFLGKHLPIPAAQDCAGPELRRDSADRHAAIGERDGRGAHLLLSHRREDRRGIRLRRSRPMPNPAPGTTIAPIISAWRAPEFRHSRSTPA